ncbi:hypothetical protein, partial [Streptomyces sp. MZ04]|uniref:hypothetical protein n=1 Tax=Streptomyces sp. MZ04 TaxID=2559236 RepID=UPI001AE0A777
DHDGRDGVVNLALTFGTLLSSQGTDASFVLTLSGFPPGASLRCFFVLAFPTLSDSFVSDFLGAFQVSAPASRPFAFPFPAVPTLSDPFGPDFQSAATRRSRMFIAVSSRLLGRSDE